jgi:hypothetical protein
MEDIRAWIARRVGDPASVRRFVTLTLAVEHARRLAHAPGAEVTVGREDDAWCELLSLAEALVMLGTRDGLLWHPVRGSAVLASDDRRTPTLVERPPVERAKVPQGWLVRPLGGGPPTFVPDPLHVWDGSSSLSLEELERFLEVGLRSPGS